MGRAGTAQRQFPGVSPKPGELVGRLAHIDATTSVFETPDFKNTAIGIGKNVHMGPFFFDPLLSAGPRRGRGESETVNTAGHMRPLIIYDHFSMSVYG